MLRAWFVVLAVALLAGCGDDSSSSVTPGPTARQATALDVSSGEPDPLAPGAYTSRVFTPAPTFTVNEGWAASVVDTQLIALSRDVADEGDCLCIIAPHGVYDPATGATIPLPADLTEWFAANPGLVATNPSSLQVGNRAAHQMEVRVAEGAALQDGRLPLVAAAEHTYSLAPGEKGHIVIIDHPDGPLILGIRAPTAEYGDYFRQVEGVVGSLTFAD
ncbi:MAG: hypothetical protein ABIP58_02800 [Dehalococcoidia bacterium]